jgi:STE24 endopeptidase
MVLKFLAEIYLYKRQEQHVLNHSSKVPEAFQEKIDLKDHQKAANYTLAKIKFHYISETIGLGLTFVWLYLALSPMQKIAQEITTSPVAQGLVFFGFFFLFSQLLSLPLDLFKTFKLEQRFGFNKSTYGLFFKDYLKQLCLGLLIGTPIIAVLLYLLESFPTNWWLMGWLFLCTIQLLLLWIFPTFIAPLFNKFTELKDSPLKDQILQLLERTGFKSNGLYVMDASTRTAHGNAYFTGYGKNKRIVFYDTLINSLEPQEVEAVLAHELGHFKKNHIKKMIAVNFTLTFISFYLLAYFFNDSRFYEAFSVEKTSYMGLILFSILSSSFGFFLTPMMSFFSRKHEYEADAFAAHHSSALDLCSALVKLYKDNANTLTPDPLFSAFYHSHPTAYLRIQHLKTLVK